MVLKVDSRERRITWKVTRRSGISSLRETGRTHQRRKFFPQRGTSWPPVAASEGKPDLRLR